MYVIEQRDLVQRGIGTWYFSSWTGPFACFVAQIDKARRFETYRAAYRERAKIAATTGRPRAYRVLTHEDAQSEREKLVELFGS